MIPRKVAAVLLLATVAAAADGEELGGGWKKKTNDEGKVVQELKIEAPTLTEEDQYGYIMPDHYKCNSCKAIIFHINAALKERHPKSRKMRQWEYTDLFDETCKMGTFKGYGVKLVDGKNQLSGPGLKQPDNIAPGSGMIQMGGETWEKRLGELCRKLVYEKVGEEELYEAYKEAGDELSDEICFSSEVKDCKAVPLGPEPPKIEQKKEKKKKDKKKKDKMPVKKTKTQAEDMAEKAVAAAKSAPAPKPMGAQDGEAKVGVDAFLRRLAAKVGLPEDEYLLHRTEKEWEKLVVSLAGRIFSRQEL